MTVLLSTTNSTIPVTTTSLGKKKDQGLEEILKKLEDARGLDAVKACGHYEKRANEPSSHRLIKSRHFDLQDLNPSHHQLTWYKSLWLSRTVLFRATITRTIMLHLLINPVSRYTLFFQLPKPFKFDTKPQNTILRYRSVYHTHSKVANYLTKGKRTAE